MADTLRGDMLKKIPMALVVARILLAPALFYLLLRHQFAWVAFLYTVALLSDIYDGVIARKLGVSTLRLRLADGVADIWLFVCLGAGILLGFRGALAPLAIPFFVGFGLQCLSWLYCGLRFKRMTSYHSMMAKLTGLCLFAGILALLLGGTTLPLALALWVFAVAVVEEIAMTAILPEYHHDVWNLKKAIELRREFDANVQKPAIPVNPN